MITCTWHGKTDLQHAGRYLEFLLTEGTREYRETPGNISVRVWKRKENEVCHLLDGDRMARPLSHSTPSMSERYMHA